MPIVFQNRIVVAFLATIMVALCLSACGSEVLPTGEPTEQSTGQPTVTPTPTTIPFQEFAGAAIPPADPVRLVQFTRLLSLIPESYSSAVYLDMEFLRSNTSLATFISPVGLDVALPSLATGLVNSMALAADFPTRSLVTSFQGDFTIVAMLQVGSSFGLQLNQGSPQTYEGHNIWDIDAFGVVLALAAADETTGVAASGQQATGSDARTLAETSLDAFDRRSARLLDAPGLTGLVGNVPSGFAAAVLSQCERLPIFTDAQALPGCPGAVVTADVLANDLIAIHALIGFADQNQALAALQRTTDALESQQRSYGFTDLGVRQEGENLRVRVIVAVSKFADVFPLFAPSS